MMQPTDKTHRNWDGFAKTMSGIAGRTLTKKELLQYCLAFMNSQYAQRRLITGHRPTPKGSYAITEAYLKEIPIPAPTSKKTVMGIIDLVDELERKTFKLADKSEVAQMEKKLEVYVREALDAVPV